MKIETVCDLCGVTFGRYPSRVRAGLAFCSGACRMASYTDPRIAALNNARVGAAAAARHAARRPLYETPLDVSAIDWSDRFWSKVAPEALSGCWLWMGAVDGKGYGAFTPWHRKMIGAHRHALALSLGRALRPDELACHRCDVPLCVNPGHLFSGSGVDNQQDCIRKGRKTTLVGESAPGAKLTAETVLAIRAAHATGETQRSIAARFGIGFKAVNALVLRRVWRHLEAA